MKLPVFQILYGSKANLGEKFLLECGIHKRMLKEGNNKNSGLNISKY